MYSIPKLGLDSFDWSRYREGYYVWKTFCIDYNNRVKNG